VDVIVENDESPPGVPSAFDGADGAFVPPAPITTGCVPGAIGIPDVAAFGKAV
jgi:hypothetical protein